MYPPLRKKLIKADRVPEVGTSAIGTTYHEFPGRKSSAYLKIFKLDSWKSVQQKMKELRSGARFFLRLNQQYHIPFIPIDLETKIGNGTFNVELRRPYIHGDSLADASPERLLKHIDKIDIEFEGFVHHFSDALDRGGYFWADFQEKNFVLGSLDVDGEVNLYPNDYDVEWVLKYSKQTQKQFFTSFAYLLDTKKTIEKKILQYYKLVRVSFARTDSAIEQFIKQVRAMPDLEDESKDILSDVELRIS